MKKIISSQYDAVSGGWHDRDGTGHRPTNNSGSDASNHSSNSHGDSDHSFQSFLSKNFPYGSGSGASGFWGNSRGTPNGYSGNGTGPTRSGVSLGGKNH